MCCNKSSNEIMFLECCWPKVGEIIAGKCREEKTLKDGLLKGGRPDCSQRCPEQEEHSFPSLKWPGFGGGGDRDFLGFWQCFEEKPRAL